MVPVVVYLLLFLLELSSMSADAIYSVAMSRRRAQGWTPTPAYSIRSITLPGCPASCGEIDIPYPFGIKPGCFRSGFQLTCTNHTLFLGGDHNGTLEVRRIDISGRLVTINAPIFTMPANLDSYSTHWTPLKGGPYAVKGMSRFNVVGCGFYAYLADSVTGKVVGMCSSVCGNKHSAAAFVGSDLQSGNGYCSVSINSTTEEYEIQLDRLYGEGQASGKAFLTSEDYRFSKKDLISPDLIGGSLVVSLDLDWEIRDRSSCMVAKRNMSTYACRSNYSFCWDYRFKGYFCLCSSWFETDINGFTTTNSSNGNPYISGGCPAQVNDKKPCLRTCGNISVPFPFGLDISCAKDATFWLNCANKTLHRFLSKRYQVTEILVEEGQLLVQILGGHDPIDGTDHFTTSQPTIMLDWAVDYMSCEDAKNSTNFACNYNHSECQDLKNFKYNYNNNYGPAYRCKCSMGYQGNPYTDPGCTDINECNDPEKNKCSGTCINSEGSFHCHPSSGSGGFKGILIGVMVAIGFLLIILSIRFLYQRWKKRSLKKIREKHFHKNRGILLQQLISLDNDNAERTKIFSFDELAKATNKFDEARVLGRGGHGTVFKGILSDQRVVAIKKSNINVQSEIGQFLNEVVILSQINHRNVVKLFGCCLETEVPLLVFEFVSNGTLSDHLHPPNRKSSLSWEDPLQQMWPLLAFLYVMEYLL